MPGPSPWPFASAIFTAFFFLALTVQAYGFAAFSAIVMVFTTLRWVWETDRPIRQTSADIGANIQVPTYRTGPSSHGWWAVTILFVVFGMIMFMAGFSFLYLYGVQPQFWIAPPRLGTLGPILLLYGGAAAFGWWSRQSLVRREAAGRRTWVLMIIAAGLLTAATWLDATGWLAAGLRPDLSGPGGHHGALPGGTWDPWAHPRAARCSRRRNRSGAMVRGHSGRAGRCSDEGCCAVTGWRPALVAMLAWAFHFFAAYGVMLVAPDSMISRVATITLPHTSCAMWCARQNSTIAALPSRAILAFSLPGL